MRVRLIKPYSRDLEWWVADGADPRWTEHDPGEVLIVSDEEGALLLKRQAAVLTEEEPT